MKKKALSILLALTLCMGLTAPALASYSDAVYGTENDHVIPKAENCSTVTTPDGKFTVTNVVRQKLCDSDYYKGHIGCVGVPIYWVADTGTEITFTGAEAGADFVLSEFLFYWEGHADDDAGPGSYTAPLKIWLNDTEQSDPVHYTDNYFYRINYQGSQLFICFAKADEAVPAEPEKPASPAFTDVSDGAYYAAPVKWAVENGITTGKSATTFAPNELCSKAHIITFLYRAVGAPTIRPGAKNPFGDVSQGSYYYDATVWAAADDVAAGTTFAPGTPCTRAMAVEFIWRALGCPEPAVKNNPFQDVAANDAILWAVGAGVTGGKTATTFAPNDTCTRAQIVTFLYRAFA